VRAPESLAEWGWRLFQAGPKPPPRRLIDRLAGPLDDMLQALVQEAGTGLAILDHQGAILRVNPCLQQMVGEGCDLSPGRRAMVIFCARQAGEVWGEIEPVLLGVRPPRKFIARLAGDGASQATAEVATVVLREADGPISGVVLTLVDISAQTRLEAQMMQSQKLQAVGEFAAGVAHDFNNLLTAVIGAADEVLARGPADPDTIDDLHQIRSSADRGADLVRQLLAFGRQQALQPRSVAVNDAVQSLTGLLRRLLGGRVSLELSLDSPGSMVRMDPTQLDQVLVNLAVNARDAMKAGGRLTLRTGQIALEQALIQGAETIPPGRYAVVAVEDTGIGIPADLLPRIFDPFFTTRRDQGGSGLGLFTVQGIIRRSGGFLTMESVEGQGTRFCIHLPRHEAGEVLRPPDPDAPAALTAAGPCGRTVLLVDDDDGVRYLADRTLRKRGWTVLGADSGEAALALLHEDAARTAALSIIVTDAAMPGLDGLALVRAVRALRPGLPAILTSGYAEATIRGDRGAEGVQFLSKPYTQQAMMAAVEAWALPAGGSIRNETGPMR
jgi:two-component system cell cycle sensor histidine kinase/response regulator CckA